MTVLGTPEELSGAGIELETQGDGDGPRHAGFARRAALRFRDAGDLIDGAVRGTLLASLVMLVISTIVLRLFYETDGGGHMTWLQAAYFTVETAATVGFGDFSFADQTPALQTFAVGLIIAGTALVSLLFAFVTDALVSRRIEASLGRARVRATSGHVVLVGLGSVGMRVLEGLHAACPPPGVLNVADCRQSLDALSTDADVNVVEAGLRGPGRHRRAAPRSRPGLIRASGGALEATGATSYYRD